MNHEAGSDTGTRWADDGAAARRGRSLRSAVEGTVFDVDDDATLLGADDDLLALTGHERSALEGAHVSRFLDDGAAAALERAAEGQGAGDPTVVEATVTTADGERLAGELRAAPVADCGHDSGAGGGAVCVARTDGPAPDPGDGRSAPGGHDRADRTDQFEAIAEQFPNGIVTVYDADLEHTLATGRGFEKLSVDPADVEGSGLREAWGDEAAETLEPALRAALEGDQRSVKLTYEDRVWWLRTVPLPADDGSVTAGAAIGVDVTYRREAERQLRRREGQLSRLMENVPGMVYRCDNARGWPMDFVSQGCRRLTGYDPERLVAGDVSFGEDLVVEADREDLWRELQEVVTDREPFSVTYRIRTADGTVRWVLDQGRGIFEDGELVGIEDVIIDMTERKRAEQEMEENARRYRTLLDNFPNGAVGLFDEDLRYVAAGGTAFEELDDSETNVVGQTVRERYPGDVAERLEPKFEAALDGEASAFEFEFHDRVWMAHTHPIEDDDGDVRWVFARGHVECDDDGSPLRFPGALADITERKQAEEELQQQRNQLETLFEVLPVGVVVADAEGRIVEANDTAADIWGGDVFDADCVADYEMYPVRDAATDEPVPPSEMTLARVVDGEEVSDPDVYEIDAFDGERRIVRLEGRPIRDADGQVTRGVVTLTDITERRRYQERLEESNERLEQFAYAASHDLQEPLRMVSSYLSLLERRSEDALDEEGQEFLEFAVDGADRMREMIEALLEYSRVETRGDPFEPVDLDAVLEDVREDLQVQIEETDATVTAGDLPTVEGDRSQLRQVFQNLLGNALEYSGEAPPRVHVQAERSEVGRGDRSAAPGEAEAAEGRPSAEEPPAEHDGDEWVVSVADEGIGIESDQQDRVFEVFQRLHSREDHEGTGIGLALCERIVERHGGRIWVESTPGEGSTFYLTLPVEVERDG